jgi:gliding motility-associated-like protein
MIEPDTLNLSLTPSIYAGGWNVTGCVNDGTIDLTVSGGVAGYTYDWDIDGTGDFDDSEDLSNLLPGWYNIQVVDANGCLINDSIFLAAPPALTSTTSVTTDYNGQDVSCQGASDGGVDVTALNGTPGYTFEWTDAQGNVISTNSFVNGVPAGWYYVLATDQNFCTAFDSIEVIDAPPLTSNIIVSSNYNGQDISCFGASDGSIDFTVNGGTPTYAFQWTDDQGNIVGTNEDLSGIPAGTYNVVMNDLNGCLIDTNITLTEPPLLTSVTSITSDYNGQDISCFGMSDGSVDVVANGGTPALSYEWTDALGNIVGGNSDLIGVPEGTYAVTVTDVNGCQVVEDIYVSQPPALNLTIDVLTDYFGMAVSCTSAQDGEIEAVVVGGTPGYSYIWDTNPVQSTAQITNLGIGTYSVTITDSNGCQVSQSVILDANPLPILSPDFAMEVCQGETVTFSSNSLPTESCVWELSNGMVLNDCGPNILLIEEIGCYDAQLTVTNEFGCVDSTFLANYICIRPNPVAAFYASDEIVSVLETDIEFINESTGATDYLWDLGDDSTATTVDAYHQYSLDQPNEYDVTLYAYNEYGCEDTAMLQIQVRDVLLFYVPNTFTPDGDEFNNVFVPVIGSGVSTENYHFIIFNRWGEIVFESYDPAFGWDGTYNGRLAQDGTYIWKLALTASQNVIEAGERREHVGHVNLIR